MNFNWRIFGGLLVFSLIQGFLYGYQQYLGAHLNTSNFQTFTNWTDIIDGVFIFVPLVLFITFYLLGKRTDIVANLKTVLISLLTGSVVGYFIGFGPFAYLFVTPSGPNLTVLYVLVLHAILSIFWMSFCVALAALSFGYASNKKSPKI